MHNKTNNKFPIIQCHFFQSNYPGQYLHAALAQPKVIKTSIEQGSVTYLLDRLTDRPTNIHNNRGLSRSQLTDMKVHKEVRLKTHIDLVFTTL